MPLALHLAVTASNAPNWKKFVQDVLRSIDEIKEDPSKNSNELSAVYGMAGFIPDKKFLHKYFHIHTEEYLDI